MAGDGEGRDGTAGLSSSLAAAMEEAREDRRKEKLLRLRCSEEDRAYLEHDIDQHMANDRKIQDVMTLGHSQFGE